MSKPLGMDVNFKIIRPTHLEDTIWDAVSEAIEAGWSPGRFMTEVRDCWREKMRDKAKEDDQEFAREAKR